MKIICGVIPCKDRFFLDKALVIIQKDVAMLTDLTLGEDSYYKIVSDLYAGIKQLMMVYLDNENIIEDRQQAVVIGKMLNGGDKDYVGYGILEFWPTSLHIYQICFVGPYKQSFDILHQAYMEVERQAKLVGAPYLSLCTKDEKAMALRYGFQETYTMFRRKL